MSEVVFIGDIGGHARIYADALRSVQADPSPGTIPHGTTIVQVGDLVRLASNRGEASDRCVTISERFLQRSPRQFVQLWGNHELAALGGPRRTPWNAEIPLATRHTLQRWWDRGTAAFACVARTPDRDYLVTHAGLTYDLWVAAGRGDAVATAAYLNGATPSPTASRAGWLVSGVADFSADVTWAEVAQELHASWHNKPAAPFDQIHGHASLWNWDADDFWPTVPAPLRAACMVDRERHLTFAPLAGETIAVGLDWMLSDRELPARPLFTLPDAVVVTPAPLSARP